MLVNQECTFFIKFRVCGSPLWTTYKVFQFLPGSGWYSYNVGTEDEARDKVRRLRTPGDVHAPEIPFIIIGSENDNSRKRCKLFI